MSSKKVKRPQSASKVNDSELKDQPCPYCKRTFQRVKTHLHSCPMKPNPTGSSNSPSSRAVTPKSSPAQPPCANGSGKGKADQRDSQGHYEARQTTAPPHQGEQPHQRSAIRKTEHDRKPDIELKIPKKQVVKEQQKIQNGPNFQNGAAGSNHPLLAPHVEDLFPLRHGDSRTPKEPIRRQSSSKPDDKKKISLTDSIKGNHLKQEEVSTCSSACNKLRDHVISELNRECSPITWSVQSAGSYYDKTKIKDPTEFDFVLFAKIICSIDTENKTETIGYGRLTPKNPELIPDRLLEKGYLSPEKFKSWTFEKLEGVISHHEAAINRRLKRTQREKSCPAFTVGYDIGGGKVLYIDLVPAIEIQGWPDVSSWEPQKWITYKREEMMQSYECVPKTHPKSRDRTLWHMSFTKSSQLIWKHADGKGEGHRNTCRKDILKYFKADLEEWKSQNPNFENINSHHLRNCMLLAFDRWHKKGEWDNGKKDSRLCQVRDMIAGLFIAKELDLIFIRGYNLLRHISDRETRAYAEHLRALAI